MTKDLGKRMLELMHQQGRTQKQVAELIGTTEATMSRYISGEREPKANVLSNIATALHTTSDHLLGRDIDQNDLNAAYTLVARNAARLTSEQKRTILEAMFPTDNSGKEDA